ncbi:MAG: SDR family oxidoreductase [Gammaproteobacteria bacterium]|nr:SDR family oxidoreductase [Gammaproteobacteria bacterium]
MTTLAGKTLFITGSTRGIGRCIALRAAADGANVVITGKSDEPNPKLPHTIHSTAADVEAAGGNALAVKLDVRDDASVNAAVEAAVEKFSGIDILINNASAISLSPIAVTPLKKYDLITQANSRGSFIAMQACLPHLKKSENGQVLSLSPPINLDKKWLASYAPYTLSKYGMTMLTQGLAFESRGKVRANCLWPATVIGTAAMKAVGPVPMERTRAPEIMGEAAYHLLCNSEYNGETLLDEDVLKAVGIDDFSEWDQGGEPLPDLFL